MKFHYLIDDISSLLVDIYIKIRNVKPSNQKRSIMKLHMKQAIQHTYEYMYDEFDDVYSIRTLGKVYILGYDCDYNEIIWMDVLQNIRNDISHTNISNSEYLIDIQVCPFDDMLITYDDIVSLLDIDCV